MPSFAVRCYNNKNHVHLYDHPTRYMGDKDLPPRTPPIEFGDPMLGPGIISKGFINKCTGAIFNPRLWIYGTYRTVLQAFRTGFNRDSQEWANRIDVFANLQLTETERVLLHMRPLNKDARYTSYIFNPSDRRGYKDEFNAEITQLFFEGDLAELFPNWQARANGPRDIGFAIGRQQIFFQDGIFINDFIDALAVTQNSLAYPGVSNLQLVGYFGVHNIHRDDFRPDRKALLLGFHSRADLTKRSIDIDVAFIHSNESCTDVPVRPYRGCVKEHGDLLVMAISGVQRIGYWGVTVRALGSIATGDKTRQANDGLLLFYESNREMGVDHDIFYLNGAVTFGRFTSVARDPTVGGPLGRVGILFAAAGIGELGSALNNRAADTVVASMGYQKFFNLNWQGIVEIGARKNLKIRCGDSFALGVRFQRGLGERCVIRFDGFVGERYPCHSVYGIRTEFVVKL